MPLKLVVSENRSNRSSGKSHFCNISQFRAIDVSNLFSTALFFNFKLLPYVFTSFKFLLKVAGGETLAQKRGRATRKKRARHEGKKYIKQLKSSFLQKIWALAAAVAAYNATHTLQQRALIFRCAYLKFF